MKSVDIFCASPASTAICSSMDQRSIVRHGIRHVERRHRLGRTTNTTGKSRTTTTTTSTIIPTVPCSSSSDIPINITSTTTPRRRSTSTCSTKEIITGQELLLPPPPPPPQLSSSVSHRKSSADVSVADKHQLLLRSNTININPSAPATLVPTKQYSPVNNHRRRRHDHRSPPSSSSILLVPAGSSSLYKQYSGQAAAAPVDNRSINGSSRPQVVELRVSIHCKGCEGKIRKHISRMEGVTSFSTDLATKKVTVVGNVTPLSVLTSISKVKYAEFWETPSTSFY